MEITVKKTVASGAEALVAEVPELGIKAVDFGGPYIDFGRGEVGNGTFLALDTVNVWDYERSARLPEHPFTAQHLMETVEEFLLD